MNFPTLSKVWIVIWATNFKLNIFKKLPWLFQGCVANTESWEGPGGQRAGTGGSEETQGVRSRQGHRGVAPTSIVCKHNIVIKTAYATQMLDITQYLSDRADIDLT